MKNLILILICFMTIQCSNDDENNNQFALDVGVVFNIVDESGQDLLNPNNNNHYNYADMKLFYLINGEIVEVYNETAHLPRNIFLDTEFTPNRLGVGTYDGTDNFTSNENGIKRGYHTAYLQLNQEDTDTILTEWEYMEGHYFKNTKIWYNSVEHSEGEIFTIIK